MTTTYLDPLLLLAGNDIARVEVGRAVRETERRSGRSPTSSA